MNKKVVKVLSMATLVSAMFVGGFCLPAEASILPPDEIYPLYDVTGDMILRAPSFDGKSDEIYEFKIIEENRDLTVLTCYQKPVEGKDSDDIIEIIFADGKCYILQHRKSIMRRIYTDYSVEIQLDEQLPSEEKGHYGPYKDIKRGRVNDK